ncbi:hypothetical protein MMC11_001644 [Xylographa trunciseda]|nr:hypothetical protein [Xylographa trunciseda]
MLSHMGQLIATLKPKSRSVEWPPPLSSYPSYSTIEGEGARTEKTITTGRGPDTDDPWHRSQDVVVGDPVCLRLAWPYEERRDHEGRLYVVDHVNLITTWEDPARESGVSEYVNGREFDDGQDDVDCGAAVGERLGKESWSCASTLKDDGRQGGFLVTMSDCKDT